MGQNLSVLVGAVLAVCALGLVEAGAASGPMRHWLGFQHVPRLPASL
jgi:hypothetical protein